MLGRPEKKKKKKKKKKKCSTTCTSCGKCVQVCPTGALFEKGRSVSEPKSRRPYLPYLLKAKRQEP